MLNKSRNTNTKTCGFFSFHTWDKKSQRSEAAPLMTLLTSHLCSWTRPPQHSLHLEQGGTNCQMGPSDLMFCKPAGAQVIICHWVVVLFLLRHTFAVFLFFFSLSRIQNLKGVAAGKKQGGSLFFLFHEGIPHAMPPHERGTEVYQTWTRMGTILLQL